MLNLTHLKVLDAVASVTEAAKELHYSQPSVSHHALRSEAADEIAHLEPIERAG